MDVIAARRLRPPMGGAVFARSRPALASTPPRARDQYVSPPQQPIRLYLNQNGSGGPDRNPSAPTSKIVMTARGFSHHLAETLCFATWRFWGVRQEATLQPRRRAWLRSLAE